MLIIICDHLKYSWGVGDINLPVVWHSMTTCKTSQWQRYKSLFLCYFYISTDYPIICMTHILVFYFTTTKQDTSK